MVRNGDIRAFEPSTSSFRGHGVVTGTRIHAKATDTGNRLTAGVRLHVLSGYWAGKTVELSQSSIKGDWETVGDDWTARYGPEIAEMEQIGNSIDRIDGPLTARGEQLASTSRDIVSVSVSDMKHGRHAGVPTRHTIRAVIEADLFAHLRLDVLPDTARANVTVTQTSQRRRELTVELEDEPHQRARNVETFITALDDAATAVEPGVGGFATGDEVCFVASGALHVTGEVATTLREAPPFPGVGQRVVGHQVDVADGWLTGEHVHIGVTDLCHVDRCQHSYPLERMPNGEQQDLAARWRSTSAAAKAATDDPDATVTVRLHHGDLQSFAGDVSGPTSTFLARLPALPSAAAKAASFAVRIQDGRIRISWDATDPAATLDIAEQLLALAAPDVAEPARRAATPETSALADLLD